MLKGIDVSSCNGFINWELVKASGIDFAIIRIGYGNNTSAQHDKRAIRNMDECTRLGIPFGCYIYSYALNEANVISEVEHMLEMIKRYKPTLGLYFDMEDADGYKKKHDMNPYTHKDTLNHFCELWLSEMKKRGRNDAGIYANYDYFTNVINYDELSRLGKIWLAHWSGNSPYKPCYMWQYSSKGKVDGISGRVDMNYLYDEDIKPSTDKYYPAYVGSLPLAAAMASLGINSSFSNRAKIAVANGIVTNEKDYKGTLEQNITMFKLLKSGSLKKTE